VALISIIDKVLPSWAHDTRFVHWLKLGGVLAAMIDAVADVALDAATASMPGQIEELGMDGYASFPTIGALPETGRDRRIEGGLTESPAAWAGRQRRHLEYHRRCAMAYALLEQVAGILGPNPPRLRLVTAGSVWYTREPGGDFIMQTPHGRGLRIDGTTGAVTAETGTAMLWLWDYLSNPAPPDQNDPGRVWLIVYAPCQPPYLAGTERQWGDGWTKFGDGGGTMDVKTIGTTTNQAWVEQLRGLAREWLPGGIKLSHTIVAFDPDSFDPLDPTGLPDGHWANHGKIVAGVRVRARLGTARYIRGVAGTSY
jgi:hypothetical protein